MQGEIPKEPLKEEKENQEKQYKYYKDDEYEGFQETEDYRDKPFFEQPNYPLFKIDTSKNSCNEVGVFPGQMLVMKGRYNDMLYEVIGISDYNQLVLVNSGSKKPKFFVKSTFIEELEKGNIRHLSNEEEKELRKELGLETENISEEQKENELVEESSQESLVKEKIEAENKEKQYDEHRIDPKMNWPEILRAAADIHNPKYKESKETIEENKNKIFFNCPFCHRGEVTPRYKILSSGGYNQYREEGDERSSIPYLAGLKCQTGDCGSIFSLEKAALLKERPDLFNKLWRWSQVQDSLPYKNKTGMLKRIYLSRANEIRNIPTYVFSWGNNTYIYISEEDYAETGLPCPKKEGEEIEVTIPVTTVRTHTVFATKELRDRWEEKQALEKELIEAGLL